MDRDKKSQDMNMPRAKTVTKKTAKKTAAKPKAAKPKAARKPRAPRDPSAGPHHRAADKPNEHRLACPECWAVPETIRNDGVSTARHDPATSTARKFRDTQFCNGQGRQSRFVLDAAWAAGTEPEASITANEYLKHGTERYEARQAKAQEKAERAAERAQKAAKKAAAPKPAKAAGKKKSRKKAA